MLVFLLVQFQSKWCHAISVRLSNKTFAFSFCNLLPDVMNVNLSARVDLSDGVDLLNQGYGIRFHGVWYKTLKIIIIVEKPKYIVWQPRGSATRCHKKDLYCKTLNTCLSPVKCPNNHSLILAIQQLGFHQQLGPSVTVLPSYDGCR